MSIESSAIIVDREQADNRRWIVEEHTDDIGVVHRVRFLAPADWDAEGYLPTRAAMIEAQLEAAEIAANMAEIENG